LNLEAKPPKTDFNDEDAFGVLYTRAMRIVVGVLRGGPSSEYDVSLKSGASVLSALDPERYEGRDIFIGKDGQWHSRGVVMPPDKALRGVDVAFNALHGTYGEDGSVQRILENLRIPYNGTGPFNSAVAFNKILTKQALMAHNVNMPRHIVLEKTEDLDRRIMDLFRSFPQPSVIKPASAGSSLGVTLARSFREFTAGVYSAFKHSPKILVEEYIKGREATVGVVDDFRGEPVYALFPVEIVPPPGRSFFDYDAKYSGTSREITPGRFSRVETAQLQRMAQLVHSALDLRHYSRSDFIVSPRGIYFLEVNTLPGLTDESLLPKSLKAVGSSLPHFLDHVITLAHTSVLER